MQLTPKEASLLKDLKGQEQHHGKAIYDYMNTNAMYA